MSMVVRQVATRSRKRREAEEFRRNTTFELRLSEEQIAQAKAALDRSEKVTFVVEP